MKKKFIILGIILIVLTSIAIIYLYEINKTEEYIPEEEISKEDSNLATVILYFQNKETKEIEEESQSINIKDLLLTPYESIAKLLFNNPESNELEKIIPDGVSLDTVEIENNTIKIEMSTESMIEDEDLINKIKESITKTLMQLNEVSSVEIKINDVQI